jgi:hypothetical protein
MTTITLTIPDETLAALLVDAQSQGRDLESLAAERLSAWNAPDPLYAAEGSEEELNAIAAALAEIAKGRTQPFDENVILRRYGIGLPTRE